MKNRIITRIKSAILVSVLAAGFLLIYTCIWFSAGLPGTRWAAALLAALSGMSAIGLIFWIAKEK